MVDRVVATLDSTAPALAASVTSLVSVLHVLRADTDDTDVSFSDPEMPYSVFLSVAPPGIEQLPRLADGLVHETLHLQLSMIERLGGPLVARPSTGWSPWKQQERELSGIVHGLYVHAGLHHLWSRAATLECEPWASFGRRRTATIADELRIALRSFDAGELSPTGRRIIEAASAVSSASAS
jgi:HEXXH motif-containing protein